MKRVDIDPYTKMLIIKFAFLKKDVKEESITRKQVFSLFKASFSRGIKAWMAPPTEENIQKLLKWGFSFPIDWQKPSPEEDLSKQYTSIKIPKSLNFLRSYQKEALQFLIYRKGRALISDDMGLGKTLEALGWIKITIKEGPALIVVPASTKEQWLREYKKYIDDNVSILYGKTPYELIQRSYIINWEILHPWRKMLSTVSFRTVVPDEAQFAGSMKAQRTKALHFLAKKIPYIIPMSGTPIESKTRQFFPILNLLAPKEFPSEWKFLNRYCDPKPNGFGMSYDGASHTKELHRKIAPLMIRRSKRDVLKDLPPLMEDVVPINIEKHMKKCKNLEKHFFDTYDPHSTANAQAEKALESIKLQIFDWKLPSIISWIDDFLTSNKKLLVGTWHHYVIDTLYEHYRGKASKIDGSVRGNKRQEALEKFYKDADILFLQMRAGGVGLDGLQKVCSTAIIVELATPTLMDQFKARIDRSGQMEPMNLWYMIAKDSIEEDLLEASDEVRKNIHAVLDGVPLKETNLLTVMYEKRKKKYAIDKQGCRSKK